MGALCALAQHCSRMHSIIPSKKIGIDTWISICYNAGVLGVILCAAWPCGCCTELHQAASHTYYIPMKVRYALLAVAALLTPAFAADNTVDPFTGVPALSAKRLSGSFTAGYNTNYSGRGLVVTHSVAEGDSSEFAALKLKYDVGKKDLLSFESTIAYTAVSSGHTLYGNPNASYKTVYGQAYQTIYSQLSGVYDHATASAYASQGAKDYADANYGKAKIKQANIENEFVVMTAVRYTRPMWNVAMGHDFIHGGLLGVMAKHYRDQGASCVNEVFITPTITPAPWFEAGVTTRYSFQGITGWWFEPQATFKAPIIGTPEDVKVAAMLTFGLSATADYFDREYFACTNGVQAYWIKLSTPWFASKNLIITPSVSFNWAGRASIKANKMSEFREYSGNPTNTPFKNFGVVGGISATYVF